MTLTLGQQELLWEALCSIDANELKRLLKFRLGHNMNHLSTETDYRAVCFEVVVKAESAGWIDALAEKVMAEMSGNSKVKLFSESVNSKVQVVDEGQPTRDPTVAPERDASQPDLSDPLLLVEEFKKNLEKIPGDEWWSAEDFANELAAVRLGLPAVRSYARSLSEHVPPTAYEPLVRELRVRDATVQFLSALDDLELCLSHLLDADSDVPVSVATRQVQWFRRSSQQLTSALLRVSSLADTREPGVQGKAEQEKWSLEGSTFRGFLHESTEFRRATARSIEEWQTHLTGSSSLASTVVKAIASYLEAAEEPAAENITSIRSVIIELMALVDHAIVMQRRIPSSGRTNALPISPTEARRIRKMCDRALDALDSYAILRTWTGQETAFPFASEGDRDTTVQSRIVAKRVFVVAFVEVRSYLSRLAGA